MISTASSGIIVSNDSISVITEVPICTYRRTQNDDFTTTTATTTAAAIYNSCYHDYDCYEPQVTHLQLSRNQATKYLIQR